MLLRLFFMYRRIPPSWVQFAELQRLEQEENQLQTEWGQLLLEEGAWATPARIEQIATERLEMRIPDVNDVEVIRP